jgi:hypothetical protein
MSGFLPQVRTYNTTGPLAQYRFVYLNTNETVAIATASAAATSRAIGLTITDTVSGGVAVSTQFVGLTMHCPVISGLTLAAGDVLYLSDTVAGKATNVAPAIPTPVAYVVDASAYSPSHLYVEAFLILNGAGGGLGLNLHTVLGTSYSLRAVKGTSVGQSVTVAGYSDIDDQAGGQFYWDNDLVTPDDAALTIVPTALPRTGCWKRNIGDYLNVKWFGAKGDGVTVDTDTIQAALDAAATANVSRVYVPTGVFILRLGLFMPSNVALEGCPEGGSILRRQPDSVWDIYNGGLPPGTNDRTCGWHMVTFKGVENAAIRHMALDGGKNTNPPNWTFANFNCVMITSTTGNLPANEGEWSKNIVVENCHIYDNGENGVTMQQCGAGGYKILDNYIHDLGYADWILGQSSPIGIIATEYVSKITISGNKIVRTHHPNIEIYNMMIDTIVEIVISHNFVEDIAVSGILPGQYDGLIVISNNICDNSTKRAWIFPTQASLITFQPCISVGGIAPGVIVEGNEVEQYSPYGIKVGILTPTATQTYRAIVTSNNINSRLSRSDALYLASHGVKSAGIIVTGPGATAPIQNVNVIGNIIHGYEQHGIWLQGYSVAVPLSYLNVSNNQMMVGLDNLQDIESRGIYLANVTYANVTNNIFQGQAQGIFVDCRFDTPSLCAYCEFSGNGAPNGSSVPYLFVPDTTNDITRVPLGIKVDHSAIATRMYQYNSAATSITMQPWFTEVYCYTSDASGAITVKAPSQFFIYDGMEVLLKDVQGNGAVNTITFNGNGANIEGAGATALVVSSNWGHARLRYHAGPGRTINKWIIVT